MTVIYNKYARKLGDKMKMSKALFLEFKKYKNSLYDDIKVEFLYHSNKMEGSTFTKDALYDAIENNMIRGNHSIDDVFETVNSIDLFDKIILDCGNPITHEMLFEYHALLKAKTSDEVNGLTGHYKTIMNRISGSPVQVAYPQEVEPAIDELLTYWNNINNVSLEDICRFHSRFEHIHPFQDGNGRIGRFIMLKQCIENNIDLIAIDDEFSETYKLALELSQTKGDIDPLVRILSYCQERLDEKLKIYKKSVELVSKEIEKER